LKKIAGGNTKMSKKVAYINLLKEALSEFDTSDTVEVKGPMLDPILSWDGGGELPTNKDAASILERYYFQEKQDRGVTVEMEYGDDGDMPKTPAMQDGKGEGTEQAGTTDKAKPIDKHEEDIAKEAWDILEDDEGLEELGRLGGAALGAVGGLGGPVTGAISGAMGRGKKPGMREQDDEGEAEDMEKDAEDMEDMKEDWDLEEDWDLLEQEDNDEGEEGEEGEEGMEESLDIENEIINRLISEMEDDDLSEAEMTYTGDGVKSGMAAPKEKKMKDPEEHGEGSGTEQAGTGDAEGQIPPRKDLHDKMVKAKQYTDEANMPINRIAGAFDEGSDADYMEEAFELFKEEIELDESDDLDEVENLDSDDLRV
jgi:hypothetical protein